MSDDKPTSPVPEGEATGSDPSSLKGLTMALGIEPAEPGQDPLLGRDIGGVTIVRLMAEGGMGRVYEGLQEKPKRKVAVKVMRPGFISRQASQRFGMELEILGKLRHPFIAQIFSAGMCDVVGSQVPYFVMEYIPDALPITHYAKQKMLGIKDRLALFHKVCDAVAHGHEHGVVHRDLKPSNILVEPAGVPKIIDFGIARSVGESPEQGTALTEAGQLIGTLQYMSPEQIAADPAAIDTRTDVYALGVILYELLTGKRPYEISSNQIFEAARIVREQKPVSPLKLNEKLSPDVVRVTGTCLQKDRANRYANAAELAAAVGHCLTNTPHVSPRIAPERMIWRTPSWHGARVHILASLTLLGLILGLVAYLYWPFPPPAPSPVVMTFATPEDLGGFTAFGDVRIAKDGGLEVGGHGRVSYVISSRVFSYPIRVEYDIVAMPAGTRDVDPGLFGSNENWHEGINLHWGCFDNQRTILYVFAKKMDVPHEPIVPGRTYCIGIQVDRNRELLIDRDGKELYRGIVPAEARLTGPVMLNGALGHVIYRQVRVTQPRSASKPGENQRNPADNVLPSSDPVVGRWRWFVNGGEFPGHEFLPNGIVKDAPDASWLLVDPEEKRYQFVWGNGRFLDVMTMSPDGKTLQGKNNDGTPIVGNRIE